MEANRAPGLRQGSRHGPSMTEQQLRDVLAEQAGRVMKLFKEWELKHEGAGGGSHREVSKAAFRAALRECGLATGAETDILFDKARRPASPARQPASPVQTVSITVLVRADISSTSVFKYRVCRECFVKHRASRAFTSAS